jgi:hypothetical protein
METKQKNRKGYNLTKSLDAVGLMRAIRDKISLETQDMSFEQFEKYIAERTKIKRLVRTNKNQS